MNTLPRLRTLVVSCQLLLLALLGVQGYLLWNTYQLTAATYQTELRQLVLGLRDYPAYAAISERQLQQVELLAGQYATRQLSQAQLRQQLQVNTFTINQQLHKFFQQQARQRPLLRDVTEQWNFSTLLVRLPGRTDTIFSSTVPLRLGGGWRGGNYSFDLGWNEFSGGLPGSLGQPSRPASVTYRQVRQVDIGAWQRRVWRRMGAVAAGTAGLLAAVVALFYVVLRSALRQRNLAELRTDLANNITHELKTPLSSVGIIIKSLQRPEVQHDLARQRPLVEALARQHERLHHTVERVLASAMAGTAAVDWQEIDVTLFLTRFAQTFLPTTHTVRFYITPGPQRSHTDPQLLEAVLGNLLDNAQKYSPPGSLIVISGQPQGAFYQLEVQDQGAGIAPAYQRQLFEKFYRAPERNLHTIKGLGLGLYLSRQAAEQVGGYLTLAHSSSQGSTFRLLLPLA